jgi:hypothetical protein
MLRKATRFVDFAARTFRGMAEYVAWINRALDRRQHDAHAPLTAN